MVETELSFGAWIATRRKALDLTREQLTQCVGYSVSGLRKLETDERRPSRQAAELLAQCLQIPPEKLPAFVKVARGIDRVERLGEPLVGLTATWTKPTRSFAESNLPIPMLPLIGREAELAALVDLLSDPQCRLLTLVGPGGMGKTRLALEAATVQRGLYEDGVHFVPLVALMSPQFIVAAIANVIGFTPSGAVDPRLQLLNHLYDRSLLLVLDNFEHLLAASGFVVELLQQAPGVKLLVTSRERLDLQGEWLFELQGLPVPPPEQAEWAEAYSAVELFVQSARRAQTGFALGPQDRPAVSRICRLVEGMPLAIELAAAWVRMLSCEEIACEIERSLDFLATGARNVPERHHSLRAVFDHSWDLLSVEERVALCRLAAFRGGFTREAARQVAGATLGSLATLAAKSLVHRTKSGRYDLHEAVGQYARARLVGDARSEDVYRRHSDFYLALLRDREGALKGWGQREAIQELAEEMGNLRAAWAWAVEHGRFTSLEQGLRSFAWLYEMRGWFHEGIQQLDMVVGGLRAISRDRGEDAVLGLSLAQRGLLFFRHGLFGQALSQFDESLAILRPLGQRALLLDALLFRGIVLFLNGETGEAAVLLEECLDIARAVGAPWFEAYAQFNLGYIASLLGHDAEAYEQMSAGLALWRSLGDPRSTALGLNYISPTTIRLGRHAEAQAFLEESLMLCRQIGDRWGMGTAYRHLGLLALDQGDPIKARTLIQRSLDIFAGFITGWDVVCSQIYLGEAVAAAGDLAEARQILLEALYMAEEAHSLPLMQDALVGLAALQARVGEVEQALELSTCVSYHAASIQQTRERAERLCAKLGSQLALQQVEIGSARTKDRTVERILEEMLGECPPHGSDLAGAR